MVSIDRLVVAAPASGHGKTTLATGLMAALTARGHQVAPFKVGPDYIDPGYHSLACHRRGRNLDPVLCGEDLIAPLFAHGSQGCDVAIVEGVMGLFDGRLGQRGTGSTAHVARLLSCPVLLVMDVGHTSRTGAAWVAGLDRFDERVRIGAVVLNMVGSQRHRDEVSAAVSELGIPVLGALPREADIAVPSRHLGLVPAAERDDAGIQAIGDLVANHVDLDAVLELAASAPDLQVDAWNPDDVVNPPSQHRPRVAVAGGRAFTFRYAETDELLRAAGCEPVIFDPTNDDKLPDDVAGLWLGGGFPQVHASELAGKQSLRTQIAQMVLDGLPTVAECAGLLYLCASLDGKPMVGVIQADAAMSNQLTVGYRKATSTADTLLTRRGEKVIGHEFHRTQLSGELAPAWLLDGHPDGFASPSLHASYLHVHWAGYPQLAQRFADAVHAYAGAGVVDLDHHGDQDLGEALVDFAVNLRRSAPPTWLTKVLAEVNWAAYPSVARARQALAARHGVSEDMVLPTAGAAEAFTLIARALPGSSRVIHPQFTAPEAALRAAGRHPMRWLLGGDFKLDAALVPPADLIMVGNPTNPTGVLHPAAALRALAADVLVVDEAFMDAIPGEPETLISAHMPGLLVLRSLTKTWALAGLRAGYVVGDPQLIAKLAAQQPPWPVSTPAAAAMVACSSTEALAQAHEQAVDVLAQRADLVARLSDLGLPVVAGKAPFVLVDTSSISNTSLRVGLAQRGFAVRRGESFPGLSQTWLRLAVRDAQRHQRLCEAIADIAGQR